MAFSTPNMGLTAWDLEGDAYSHTDLTNNWAAVDIHDHSAGKGVSIGTAGIQNSAITRAKLAAGTITTSEISASAGILGTQLANGTIGTNQIANGAVTSAKLDAGVGALFALPSGVVMQFGGSSAPAGYLFCDGSTVSRSTYASLFSAVGTTWGAGDGSTTFKLPDLRGRAPVGVGSGAGLSARALAAVGGEETHVLTVNELASHAHGVSDPGHRHSIGQNQSLGTMAIYNSSDNQAGHVGIAGSVVDGVGPNFDLLLAADILADFTIIGLGINNTGSGTAHNNLQPFVAINFIIKT